MDSKHHYHIRWSSSAIDWKAFPTSEEAAELAEGIKKPNESYVIEKRDSGCETCSAFRSKSAGMFSDQTGEQERF